MPGRRRFVGGADAQYARVPKRWSGDLKTHGQSPAVEAARDRERRQPRQVEGSRGPNVRERHLLDGRLEAELRLFLFGGGRRKRRRQQRIEVMRGKCLANGTGDEGPRPQRPQVVLAAHHRAGNQQRSDVRGDALWLGAEPRRVIGRSLGGDDAELGRQCGGELRNRHADGNGPHLVERIDGGLKGLGHVWLTRIDRWPAEDAEAKPFDPRVQRDQAIHSWGVGNDVHRRRGTRNRRRQGTEVVERPRQRLASGARNHVIGGLEPDDTTERGRNADRPAGIGAQGHGKDPGGNGCAGPTAGAAWDSSPVPRVRGGSAGDATREFVGGGLTHDDGIGGAQSPHHFGVGARGSVGIRRRSASGGEAPHRQDVLDADGDSGEWTGIGTALLKHGVGSRRRAPCAIDVDDHHRAKGRIESLDVLEGVSHESAGRGLSATQRRRHLGDGERSQSHGRSDSKGSIVGSVSSNG